MAMKREQYLRAFSDWRKKKQWLPPRTWARFIGGIDPDGWVVSDETSKHFFLFFWAHAFEQACIFLFFSGACAWRSIPKTPMMLGRSFLENLPNLPRLLCANLATSIFAIEYYRGFQKKRKISKTRTPYNIRDAKHKFSCMRAQAGLTFFREKLDLPFRNCTPAGEGFEAPDSNHK